MRHAIFCLLFLFPLPVLAQPPELKPEPAKPSQPKRYEDMTPAEKEKHDREMAAAATVVGGMTAGFACFLVFCFVVVVVLSLIPGIVASVRHHPNAGAIFATAILLGWTGIGWIVALIWAFTNPVGASGGRRSRYSAGNPFDD
jgi:hypothetical protein